MNPALLIFSALFALAGYQEARRFARQHGATPWGWDPWVWAIVMFLSWVIGLVLLAIAERQGRRHPRRSIPPTLRRRLLCRRPNGQLTPAAAISSDGGTALPGPPTSPPTGSAGLIRSSDAVIVAQPLSSAALPASRAASSRRDR